jgi:HAD superfamily hydrolase (TIGR01509 family)
VTVVVGGVAISAAIFDMDGLLLDSEPIALRAWERAAESLGLEFDLGLCRQMIGRNFRDCRDLIRARHGADYPVIDLTQAWASCYDGIIAAEGVALKPGIDELLDLFDDRAVTAAVATSTRRERAELRLRQAGLLHRFAALVGGDEVARGKPEPDTFVLAAQRLGLRPEQCIVLEDSEPGVTAAWAAGMTPIMVPDLHPPSAALLTRGPLVLSSLTEVALHLAATDQRK